MGHPAEKPGVVERLASALNSNNLAPDGERARPVDLIGALGYTQINPDREAHAEVEVPTVDARTELGSVLMRVKYAGDRALLHRGQLLLSRWVMRQRAYTKWKIRPGADDLFGRFIAQGLAEWLDPVCPACHGRQLLGMERGAIRERRVRCQPCKGAGRLHRKQAGGALSAAVHPCQSCLGKGWLTRTRVVQDKPRACSACNGTGHARPNDTARALVLGVQLPVYEKHWLRRFDWLAAALDGLDRHERNCLQAQFRSD